MSAANVKEPVAASEPPLIDVHAVASMLGCSTQHVFRLASSGNMPRPIRLLKLVRWNREILDAWIADGCPAQQPEEGVSQ